MAEEILFRSKIDERGYTMMYNIVLLDTRLSHPAYRTLMLLLYYARQDDHCWPGQKEIASRLGCNLRTVQRHLDELHDLGLISIERRGNNRTNRYWIEDVRDAYSPDKTASSSDMTEMSSRSKSGRREMTFLSGGKAGDMTEVTPPIEKKNQRVEEESTSSEAPVQEDESVVVLLHRLESVGVTKVVARRLLASSGPEVVGRQLEWISHRGVKDKAAALVSAIKEDWTAPPAVVEAREREELRAKADEDQRVREEKRRELAANALSHQQALDEIWALFDEDEQAEWMLLAEASIAHHAAVKRGGVAWNNMLQAKITKALEAIHRLQSSPSFATSPADLMRSYLEAGEDPFSA